MELKIKKLSENAVIPFRADSGSAGLDIVCISVKYDEKNDCWVYGTGLSSEFSPEYVGYFFPRSSNRKTDYYMPNSVGCLDSSYRGEWLICLKSRDFTDLRKPPYEIGDKIAQVIFQKLPDINISEVDALTDSERGTGGFGSSGR